MKRPYSLLMALPLLLAGCGQPSTEQAEAQLCTDLAQFKASLTEFSQINANSQVNDLRGARENVAKSFQAVRDSAATVEAARLDDLQAAQDNIDSTINGISGRETVGEAATQVADSLANAQAAEAAVSSGLNCTP